MALPPGVRLISQELPPGVRLVGKELPPGVRLIDVEKERPIRRPIRQPQPLIGLYEHVREPVEKQEFLEPTKGFDLLKQLGGLGAEKARDIWSWAKRDIAKRPSEKFGATPTPPPVPLSETLGLALRKKITQPKPITPTAIFGVPEEELERAKEPGRVVPAQLIRPRKWYEKKGPITQEQAMKEVIFLAVTTPPLRLLAKTPMAMRILAASASQDVARYLPKGMRMIDIGMKTKRPQLIGVRAIQAKFPGMEVAKTKEAQATSKFLQKREAARIAYESKEHRQIVLKANINQKHLERIAKGEVQSDLNVTKQISDYLVKAEKGEIDEHLKLMEAFGDTTKQALYMTPSEAELSKKASKLLDVKGLNQREITKIISLENMSDRSHWWTKVTGTYRPVDETLGRFGKQGKLAGALADEAYVVASVKQGHVQVIVDSLFSKMTTGQKAEHVAHMNDLIPSRDPIVRRSVAVMRGLMQRAQQDANKIPGMGVKLKGGQVVPIPDKRGLHFPHYMDEEAIATKAGREGIIKKLMEKEKLTPTQALQRFNKSIKDHARIMGNLERPREMDLPDWIEEPNVVYNRYFHQFFERTELAKRWGANNEIVDKIIERIPTGTAADIAIGKDAQSIAYAVKEIISGIRPMGHVDQLVRGEAIRVSDLIVRRYMAMSAINNTTQGITGALTRTGILPTFKGLYASARKGGVQFTREAGAIYDSFGEEFVKFAKTKTFLDRNMFTFFELKNRVIMANATKYYLKPFVGELTKHPTNKRLLREAGYLMLNPKEIIKRGYLTRDEIHKASSRLTFLTQMKFSPSAMPYYYSTPMGKGIYSLQSFNIGWLRYLRSYVFPEAKRGNIMPLIKLIGYGQLDGEIKASIWAVINGKDRKSDWTSSMAFFERMAYHSSLGIMSEALFPGMWSKTKAEQILQPVPVSLVADIERIVLGPLRGNWQDPAKVATRIGLVPWVAFRKNFFKIPLTGGLPGAILTRAATARLIPLLPKREAK